MMLFRAITNSPVMVGVEQPEFNWSLLTLVMMLISIGFVMVASSSMAFAEAEYGDAWYFVKRHMIWLGLALIGSVLVAAIPMTIWQQYGSLLLIVAVVLLILVLIPGVGRRVNGSQRWLQLGPFTLQASEAVKFCMIVFFASFLARRREEILASWSGVLKPLLVLGAVVFLLLLEPDFGGSVVLAGTVMGLMFIAGVRLKYFSVVLLGAMALLAVIATSKSYRIERLKTYLDPWADQFDSGYQLTQSLIAFGRGEWFGLGLGNSVQKLFFLPEAHTDFIFAIVAEELGLIGAVLLIGIFVALIVNLLATARRAMAAGAPFASYVAFGVAIMFAAQAFINIGVASGLLPTKGLTLPFISYGGSSLLVSCAFVALLLRLDWDIRCLMIEKLQPKKRARRSLKTQESQGNSPLGAA